MKIDVNQSKAFRPVKLELEMQSLNELKMFLAIINTTTNSVKKFSKDTPFKVTEEDTDQLEQMIDGIYAKVELMYRNN